MISFSPLAPRATAPGLAAPGTAPARAFARKPELLAPAGDWECARAAVANGADAVYFGLPAFNARLRATNFSPEDVIELVRFLHAHGVKGYAAFNVLIFSDELDAAAAQLRFLAETRVDAVIVQDLGLADLARRLVPDLAVHASTQMTLTSPEGVAFARRLGVRQAVLARELSLGELEKFRASEPNALPLEVFVHGALCVAYSGQCLTSEALGQRSANRGECAQACRLPYELFVDGIVRDLGSRRYLLSPQDLAAVEQIPELIRLGLASFKIEGRLKQPEYVAAVTQVYRAAIDRAWAEATAREAGTTPQTRTPGERYRLEMAFSRGLYPGWLQGVNHQELVHARFGKKRGALVGTVLSVGRETVELLPLVPLAPGDGLVFDRGGDPDQEVGGRVYEIGALAGGRVRLGFAYGRLDFSRVQVGDRVWKTDDPQLNRALQQSWSEDRLRAREQKESLDLVVTGEVGQPLRVTALAGSTQVVIESAVPLQMAQNRPLTESTLREQFGRLGGTPFVLGALDHRLPGAVILPLSELNRLRRELVQRLGEERASAARLVSAPGAPSAHPAFALPSPNQADAPRLIPPGEVHLTVLCRTLAQIEAALAANIREIYADFEDIRRYREAVERVRQSQSGAQILLATPRIQKAGEHGFFRQIAGYGPDGVLLRNLGALDFFAATPLRRVGDFSLNVANPLTAQVLRTAGLDRLTVSYDLNTRQVLDLLQASPPEWYEITLHQHIPMFHMEHCVFAAFLSTGTDHTNCGRPCDRHQLELRDRVGLRHPVKADVGCRNTVFHAQAQSGAAAYNELRTAGAAAFRVELLGEDGPGAARVITAYQALLASTVAGSHLLQELGVRSQLGVTNPGERI